MALLLALVLAITVSTLLTMLNTEYRMVHRSYHYNEAIHLAETAVEEGIAMMTYGGGDWAGNGWSSTTNGYTKTVTNFYGVGSSSSIGSYTVSVSDPSGSNPQITGTAVVSNSFLGSAITRSVRVIMAGSSLFNWGLRAKGQISLNGNAEVDSFDSSDPNYSNYNYSEGYGTYTSSKRKENGDAATNGSTSGIVSLSGNAGIRGNVSTGPSGTVSTSGNAKVTITGYVRLHVTGNLSTSGNGRIIVASGGKLEMYVGGSSNLSGNGVQNNAGTAEKYQLYFLSNSSVSIAGNGDFTGVVYAPDRNVSISGNGDLVGAVVASTIAINGNGEIHYDEALKNMGESSSMSIVAWEEL